ncbi:hypothetical protein MMC21_003971 [Puttea exsequens]|nr:hypothetical protein [Puttea exsequens]
MTDIAAITVASQAWIDEQQSLLTLASLSPGPIQYETMGPAPNDGPTSMTITSNAPKSTPKPAAAPSSTSPPGVTNDESGLTNLEVHGALITLEIIRVADSLSVAGPKNFTLIDPGTLTGNITAPFILRGHLEFIAADATESASRITYNFLSW